MTQKGPTMTETVEQIAGFGTDIGAARQEARIMTQTPAADIVEQARMHRSWRDSHGELSEIPHRMATEIEALRAREANLQHQLMLAKAFGDSEADAHNAVEERARGLLRKLDEVVKAQDEALTLIDEINERGASRRFYGIAQPLHAKICTIRATLVRWSALASIRGETE